jgi:hypothetical protein
MKDSMQTKRIKTLLLLTALSLTAGACTSPSISDRAFNSYSGVVSPEAYTRSIFSSNNF